MGAEEFRLIFYYGFVTSVNLYVESCGAGQDLALLHGWAMHSGVWNGVKEKLAHHFRLHIVDLPGYGQSPISTPNTLEHIAALIASSLPERVSLCGWSLGGLIAMEIARKYPEKTAHLVLVASTPCFVRRENWRYAMVPETLLEFANALECQYESTLKRFITLQARGDNDSKTVSRLLRESQYTAAKPSIKTLTEGLKILIDTDLRGLTGYPPALIVHGDRDRLVPLRAALWQFRHRPGSQLKIIHGAAHAPFLSHPAEFVETLKNYWDAHG